MKTFEEILNESFPEIESGHSFEGLDEVTKICIKKAMKAAHDQACQLCLQHGVAQKTTTQGGHEVIVIIPASIEQVKYMLK